MQIGTLGRFLNAADVAGIICWRTAVQTSERSCCIEIRHDPAICVSNWLPCVTQAERLRQSGRNRKTINGCWPKQAACRASDCARCAGYQACAAVTANSGITGVGFGIKVEPAPYGTRFQRDIFINVPLGPQLCGFEAVGHVRRPVTDFCKLEVCRIHDAGSEGQLWTRHVRVVIAIAQRITVIENNRRFNRDIRV